MNHDELIRKGAAAKLREELGDREVQIKAKIRDISWALNEYLVDDLAELRVDDAEVLMRDLVQLMADYRAKLAKLKDLEG